MRETWPQWEALGAAALFVVLDDPARVRRSMLDGLDVGTLPFAVLVDRERTAYARWGLGRARWWTVWLDPAVMRFYWRAWRTGERLRPGGEDTLQLGGDFIVAADGRVVYARPQQRDDRPPVGELLRAIRDGAS